MSVVRRTARTMAQDPAWSYAILDPTEMLGVEGMSHAGLTLLLWIRTRPLQQFLVAREFRRRLRLAFEQEDIAIGVPQQVFTGQSGPEAMTDTGGFTSSGPEASAEDEG